MQRRRRCAVAEREDKKVCRWCIRAKEAEGPDRRGGWWVVGSGAGVSFSEKPEAQSEADAAVQVAHSSPSTHLSFLLREKLPANWPVA